MNSNLLVFLLLVAFSTTLYSICERGEEVIVIYRRDNPINKFEYGSRTFGSLNDVTAAIKKENKNKNKKIKEKVLILDDEDMKKIRYVLVPKQSSSDRSDEDPDNLIQYSDSGSEEN